MRGGRESPRPPMNAKKGILMSENLKNLNPSEARDVLENLGLAEEPRGHFDVAIIGQGPAGLTAALYAARAGLSTAVFERMGPGGQMNNTEHLDNYPGFAEGVNPFELAFAMQEQAKRFGALTVNEEVASLDLKSSPKRLIAVSGAVYTADAVILAMGAEPKQLGIPREQELTGRGVSYCATCDGGFFRGKTVAVVGGGNTAVGDALYLSRLAEEVHLIHRRDEFRADASYVDAMRKAPNVVLHLSSVVEGVSDVDGAVAQVAVRDLKTGEVSELAASALFIAVGSKPLNSLVLDAGLQLDAEGYVVAGESGITNVPGVFVAGDVRAKEVRQVVTAAADGANAAMAAFEYLSLHDGI